MSSGREIDLWLSFGTALARNFALQRCRKRDLSWPERARVSPRPPGSGQSIKPNAASARRYPFTLHRAPCLSAVRKTNGESSSGPSSSATFETGNRSTHNALPRQSRHWPSVSVGAPAAVPIGDFAPLPRAFAMSVTDENNPNSNGIERAIARSFP